MQGFVKLALAKVDELKVENTGRAYKEILSTAHRYYEEYKEVSAGSVPGVSAARNLFKKIGIDPTKRRPSSEALLRRALKQIDFSNINDLVDTGNWCSLEFLLPICVYDGRRISGGLKSGIGKENEGYIAIDGKYLDLSGRYLIYDDNGALGSPIKDSMRTRVTEETKLAWLVIYASDEISDDTLNHYLSILIERTIKLCGGKLLHRNIMKTEK